MYLRTNWRLASHSGIFNVCTVVGPQSVSSTVNESGLSSTTLDIVQPDLASTISEAVEHSHGTCSTMILTNLEHLICKDAICRNRSSTHQWLKSPTDDTLLWHQECPKSHHTLCPRYCCCRLPHVQLEY